MWRTAHDSQSVVGLVWGCSDARKVPREKKERCAGWCFDLHRAKRSCLGVVGC